MGRLRLGALVGALLLWLPAAAQAQASGSRPPTFEQVMAAPDDPVLNTAYAKQQIAAGNFLFAAAAYERLLMGQPDDDVTRVAYAEVLLNLDDPVTAGQELSKLHTITLTPDQQAQVAILQQRVNAKSAGAVK
jgi:predicted Zn-dependent protease